MASRFWISGSGTWNPSNTANWSTSSGGSGGASVPTSVDDVFLDANSGAGIITIQAVPPTNILCKSITCTGFTGTLTGNHSLNVYGSCLFVAGMTYSITGFLWLHSAGNLTTGGKTIAQILVSGSSPNITLLDNLTISGQLHIANGSFDANNNDVTCGWFTSLGSILMGSGTWEITAVGSNDLAWDAAGSVTEETSTVKINNSTGDLRRFVSVSSVYNDIWFTGSGAGVGQIEGSNLFNDIKVDAGKTLYLENGETQTCATITMTGTAGSHITLSSDSVGNTAALAVTTPTIERVDIQDIVASVGTFDNASGFDNGNNTGIRFLFENPANLYSSDNVYATCDASSGVIGIRISKDNGANWSAWKTKTFVAGEATQTFGSSTDNWGVSLIGSDLNDGNFKVQIYTGVETETYSNYETFGFVVTAGNAINGIEINLEAKWDGSLASLDHMEVKAYSGTSEITVVPGAQSYASNGRKNGEGAGNGTGVLVFYDESGNWIASDTGQTVQA